MLHAVAAPQIVLCNKVQRCTALLPGAAPPSAAPGALLLAKCTSSAVMLLAIAKIAPT